MQGGKGLVSSIRSTELEATPLVSTNASYPKLNPTVGMTVPLTYQTGATAYALRNCQPLAECGTQLGLGAFRWRKEAVHSFQEGVTPMYYKVALLG